MQFNRLWLCVLTLGLMATPVLAAPTKARFDPEEQTSINVYKSTSPAVVTVSSRLGSGAGTVISPEGLVLTNEHVIRNAPRGTVTIQTSQGKRYTGQVTAVDRRNDLALVRLTTQDRFSVIPLADQDGIQVGQQVFAIGNPFGLSGTFTRGILSRISRNGDLQTDAALNPGNSGGPLLNSRGELIGVNKAILSPDGGNVGIGFATSAVVARNFIQQYQKTPTGTVAVRPNEPPRLGVSLDAETLVIQQVQPGSLAAELGLRTGDQLVAINGQPLAGTEDLREFLDSRPDSAVFTVARNRRLTNLRVDF
ncbi:S1C family serine protease [Candidatus Cyanaurora vandensis]|uniref:S1C family serine protease n=1 Tax=Candidatus Cyanaurora vandensis TaxID=2714958 RepID=UPI002580BA3C|nr:trypsin-like peptidase domain-containing protein [Candidatus Cyanaurora vandensis]